MRIMPSRKPSEASGHFGTYRFCNYRVSRHGTLGEDSRKRFSPMLLALFETKLEISRDIGLRSVTSP